MLLNILVETVTLFFFFFFSEFLDEKNVQKINFYLK